ncbi:alpha/beta hydrolase [Geobacter sp. AOG1]|uniref:alpha/beta fold hydrolase n=1 Tax=Geobacter sp. AOG1 TaxID=1566346 RepID=UPI0027E4C3DD|nr:alpha/beta hydrolase [Geobacter sp. AOG1]
MNNCWKSNCFCAESTVSLHRFADEGAQHLISPRSTVKRGQDSATTMRNSIQATYLVLLPGMDGTGKLFGPLLRRLPDWVHPIVVSYPPDRVMAYDELLAAVRASLPRGEPYVILGESFSGPLALMAAADCPGDIRGVILCASFVKSPLVRMASWLSFLVGPLTVRLVPWTLKLKVLFGAYGADDIKELFASIRGSVSPEVMAARAKYILELDCTDELRKCPVPLLYITATDDALVTRRSLALIQRVRPDVTVATIEGPHLILQYAPVETARAIQNFIEICRVED